MYKGEYVLMSGWIISIGDVWTFLKNFSIYDQIIAFCEGYGFH